MIRLRSVSSSALSELRRRAVSLDGAFVVVATVTGSITACGSLRAAAPPLAPGAQAVEVTKAAPPAGAMRLGPIEGVSGQGCGLRGSRGSYEGAEADLRNAAEHDGGDYVQITQAIVPHVEGGCYDERFTLRGVLYRVNPAPPAAPPRVEACDPACSPGYVCEEGACRARCQPACAADQVCGQDRTCRAAPRP